jgi:hypothetical protein
MENTSLGFCLEFFLEVKSSSSPGDRSKNDCSRRYFRQCVLDISSHEDLEMMLQEKTEQLQDLGNPLTTASNTPTLPRSHLNVEKKAVFIERSTKLKDVT